VFEVVAELIVGLVAEMVAEIDENSEPYRGAVFLA